MKELISIQNQVFKVNNNESNETQTRIKYIDPFKRSLVFL